MTLKTFNFQGNGVGTIVIDDDATNRDIAKAMMLDATEKDSTNGRPGKKVKEEQHD